jgi:hypothetical protein
MDGEYVGPELALESLYPYAKAVVITARGETIYRGV